MTPSEIYQQKCDSGAIVRDEEQAYVVRHLQQVYDHLLQERKARSGVLARLRRPRLVSGLYLWGGVGIGKTFLMDCFFDCIPFSEKMRMHFHVFMRMVHQQLTHYQGQKNPLQLIAKELAQRTMLLCFDEFFVSEIVDAMLLARLLKALFHEGVCLVATSNVAPDELYKRGLQRDQFLPAISQLKQHTTVIHIPSSVDYRLQYLKSAGVFFSPPDAAAEQQMDKMFAMLSHDVVATVEPILICGRSIPIVKQVEGVPSSSGLVGRGVVWFLFQVICRPPRSQHDYLAITEKYHTIFVSHIPVISVSDKDTISLFIRLVDVLYDARVRLIFSAERPVNLLYPEGRLAFEFQRTVSRLLEMQSEEYFLKSVE